MRQGLIASALNHAMHRTFGKENQPPKDGDYSIKGEDGKELNPRNYILSNKRLTSKIKDLYGSVKAKVGDEEFTFEITGGDRYVKEGKVYSSADNKIIPNAGIRGPHIETNGARAVDLRTNIPYAIIEPLANKIGLYYQKGYYPHDYQDNHHHLFLLKGNKTNWAENN